MTVLSSGRWRIAVSSASLGTPPFQMTVILVMGPASGAVGLVFRLALLRGFLAASSAYRGLTAIQGWGAWAEGRGGIFLGSFLAASAGVGSGWGGIGGGGVLLVLMLPCSSVGSV